MQEVKSKKRKIMVRRYAPPQEVRHRLMTKDQERPSKNKFLNFIKTFLGDGF